MKRLLVVLVMGMLLVGGVVAAWLEPGGRLPGWMRGEPFYEGRPASWWARQVRDDDPSTQDRALQRLRGGKEEALPVVLVMLRETPGTGWDTSASRWRAAELLGEVGGGSDQAVSALCEAVRDDDPLVRPVAIRSLGRLAPGAGAEAVGPLTKALDGTDRLAAIQALFHFGPLAEPAVPALRRCLKANDPTVRWNAARTLRGIGKGAGPAVPDLIEALKDRDALVREQSAEALGRISLANEEVVTALSRILDDPDARVRRDAVRSLGWLGGASRPHLDAVRRLKKDPNDRVRKAAHDAEKQIAPTPAPPGPKR
jgi:HEAT repeat protein